MGAIREGTPVRVTDNLVRGTVRQVFEGEPGRHGYPAVAIVECEDGSRYAERLDLLEREEAR